MRFFTFAEMTAFAFSCGVPTLNSGTLPTAAMLVPPSATSSAIEATTIAGDGRRVRRISGSHSQMITLSVGRGDPRIMAGTHAERRGGLRPPRPLSLGLRR